VNRYRMTCAAAMMAMALAGAATVPAFAAGSVESAGSVLKRGSQWMLVRAGYAKGSGEVAADGLVGGGFGFRRFVLDRWAVGAFAHYDLLGRFGGAADISVPLTIEVTRHSRWGAAVYPYVGVGGGAFYTKLYRTGEDASGFTPGRYLTFGADFPIRRQSMIGIDVRMATVDKFDANPAFPGPAVDRQKIDDLLVSLKGPTSPGMPLLFNADEAKTRTLWSVKLDFSINY
jgi:outer membrane protein W